MITPAVEAQCRARGIDRSDIDYALANPNYEIPVKGLLGARQIVANIGKGRLFLKYSKVSETDPKAHVTPRSDHFSSFR